MTFRALIGQEWWRVGRKLAREAEQRPPATLDDVVVPAPALAYDWERDGI